MTHKEFSKLYNIAVRPCSFEFEGLCFRCGYPPSDQPENKKDPEGEE